MTHDYYKAKRKDIDIQITALQSEKLRLEHTYIEERRMISQFDDVIYQNETMWFTGNCDIDPHGNLLYELDGKSRKLIYKLFEEFEVVE